MILPYNLFATSSNKTLPTLVCKLDSRTIEIDLSQKITLTKDNAYKAEFFLGNAMFGSCLFKIVREFDAKGSQSPKNLIFLSKESCKFISEKQSKDLLVADKGSIIYNLREKATVDILLKRRALKCIFKSH